MRHLARALPALVVVVALAVVAMLALTAPGFPLKKLELHDSGIWVTNDLQHSYGRVNKSARGLDAYLEPPGAGGGVQPLDVLQDGGVVIESDPATSVLVPVDSMAVTNQGDAAVALLPGSATQLGGGTVATINPDGGVWAARYDPDGRQVDVRGFDPANKPIAELGKAKADAAHPVAIAVDILGTIHAVSSNGKVATITATDGVFQPPVYTQLSIEVKGVQATTVGTQLVVLDPENNVLILPDGKTKQLGADPAAVLQQPGPEAPQVLIGTSTGLNRVSLADGQLEVTYQGVSGAPAAPVRLQNCDFGVWGGAQGGAVRTCDGGQPEVQQPVAKGQPLQRPAFRVNRGQIVLNDSADGRIFDLDAQQRIDNWDKVRPPKNPQNDPNQSNNTDKDIRESKPKANPDNVGARPGRTTVLYLLDNDTDSASGILMIQKVSGLPDSVKATVSPDGQTVALDIPAGAARFRFQYTISNGFNSDTADVQVAIRGDGENGKPALREGYQAPDYSVASFGTLAVPVTADWRDPDGDPVTLLDASVNGVDLPISPDGRLEFTPGREDSTVRRVVTYHVTDAQAEVAGSLKVKVLKAKSVTGAAPVALPDAARGEAGKAISFYPLGNDIPGSDPRNPQARLVLAGPIAPQPGLKVSVDDRSGRVTATAAKAGSYFLDYTAALGSSRISKSRIRLDVVRDKAGSVPVAMPDQVAIRGNGSVLSDVVFNDSDPLGGMLTVQQATADDPDQLAVSVVAGRWLLIEPKADSVSPNPQVVHYTVTNGVDSATGDVKVTVLPSVKKDRPLVRDDLAVVRDGDSVLIVPFANDTSTSGRPLSLVTNNQGLDAGKLPIIDPAAKDGIGADLGTAFVRGDRIRYVAPAKVTSERQVVITYLAQTVTGERAAGKVTVTIKPQPENADANLAPTPEPVELRVTSGDRVTVPVPLSGQDPDGDSVTVLALGSAPRLGRVTGLSPSGMTYEAYPNEDATGTDVFSVVVADRYGKTGVATIRLAVVPPGQADPPVVLDDIVRASPNAIVRADVLSNDLFARTDRVRIQDLAKQNEGLPAGITLMADTGPIRLQAPAADGQPVLIDYVVDGNGGQSAPAALKVISEPGYRNPPVVADLLAEATPAGTATIDLLEKAWDPDGVDTELTAALLGGPAEVVLTGAKASIPMLDHPQVIPYQVTDPTGATSAAVVVVPARGAGVPQLKVDGLIEVAQDATVTVTLGDYVSSPRERSVRLTNAEQPVTSPAQVSVERIDATHFKVIAKDGYVGPAAVTLDVMDGDSVSEPGIARGFVTIPIQVGPRTPVMRCPAMSQSLVAGGRAKELDIVSLCHVWSPDPAKIGDLKFTATWANGNPGIDVTPGHTIRLQAPGSAVPGAEGTLSIGIEGFPAKPQLIRARVLKAGPPTMKGRSFTDIKQGTPVRIPMGINSPLIDAVPHILKVDQESGPGAKVSFQGSVLTITPNSNVDGKMTFIVRATDVAAPDRQDRWVSARVSLEVYGVPSAPGVPQPGARAQSHAETLTWTPADPNGATVTGYEVLMSTGKTQACQVSPCQITGLTNNVPLTFKVRAQNKAGWGPPSAASRTITPDEPPPAVTGLKVSNPQDHRLTLSWTKVVPDGSPVKTYWITYGGETVQATGAETSKVLQGMDNNTIYTISIVAENNYDLGPSSSIKGQSAGKPLGLGTPKFTPNDLQGADTSLKITWAAADKNGPNDLTYKVVRNDGKTICSGVAATTCTDDQVVFQGATYTYTVTATNGAGGTEHSASTSGSWTAVGTPDTPPALVHTPTGRDHEVRVQGSAPDSRGKQSRLEVYADGSLVKSLNVSPRGETFDTLVTVGQDGHWYDWYARICNETRCGPKSPVNQELSYGPIQGLSAANGGSSGTNVTLRVSVNPNGWPVDIVVNGKVEATTGYGDSTWSGSFTYNLGAYKTSRTFTVVARNAKTPPHPRAEPSDSITLTSEDPPPPPRTLTTWGGNKIITVPGMCDYGCTYVYLKSSNFSGSTSCKIWTTYKGTHVWSNFSFSGDTNGNTGSYFGHWGESVWFTCDGVESNHEVWQKP